MDISCICKIPNLSPPITTAAQMLISMLLGNGSRHSTKTQFQAKLQLRSSRNRPAQGVRKLISRQASQFIDRFEFDSHNRTSSKATTVWPVDSVKLHVPRFLYQKLRSSRYYVSSSDSFSIQCGVHRNRSENKDETHRRLNEEIRQIYKSTVPGVTSPEQKQKVEHL